MAVHYKGQNVRKTYFTAIRHSDFSNEVISYSTCAVQFRRTAITNQISHHVDRKIMDEVKMPEGPSTHQTKEPFGCADKPAEKHCWLICCERKILFQLKKQAEKDGL
jgi:hypothetical protein